MSEFLYLTSGDFVKNLKDLKDLYEESLKIEDRISHLINGVLDRDLERLAKSLKALYRKYNLEKAFTFGSSSYPNFSFVCANDGLEIRAYPYSDSDDDSYVTHTIPWPDLSDPENYLLKIEAEQSQAADQSKRVSLKKELASKIAKLEQLKQEADKLNSEIQELNSI